MTEAGSYTTSPSGVTRVTRGRCTFTFTTNPASEAVVGTGDPAHGREEGGGRGLPRGAGRQGARRVAVPGRTKRDRRNRRARAMGTETAARNARGHLEGGRDPLLRAGQRAARAFN